MGFSFLLLSNSSIQAQTQTESTNQVRLSKKKKINAQAFHLCELAVQIAQKGDYETAITYLKRSLELEPKFPEALFNLGSIYRIQKKYEDSYSTFLELLQKNPEDNEARLEKVLTLIAMNSLKEAGAELNKVPNTENRYSEIKDKLNKALLQNHKPNKVAIIEDKPKILLPEGLYKTPFEKQSLSFNAPTGITADKNNNIYIANFSENTIEKVWASGSKRQIFAEGDLISGPSGLAYNDSTDELLIANYKSGTIVKVDQLGQMKVLIDKLEKPYSIFLDKDGKLYISEQGKKAVSIITLRN